MEGCEWIDPDTIKPDKVYTDLHGNTYELWWAEEIGRYVTIPNCEDDE